MKRTGMKRESQPERRPAASVCTAAAIAMRAGVRRTSALCFVFVPLRIFFYLSGAAARLLRPVVSPVRACPVQ